MTVRNVVLAGLLSASACFAQTAEIGVSTVNKYLLTRGFVRNEVSVQPYVNVSAKSLEGVVSAGFWGSIAPGGFEGKEGKRIGRELDYWVRYDKEVGKATVSAVWNNFSVQTDNGGDTYQEVGGAVSWKKFRVMAVKDYADAGGVFIEPAISHGWEKGKWDFGFDVRVPTFIGYVGLNGLGGVRGQVNVGKTIGSWRVGGHAAWMVPLQSAFDYNTKVGFGITYTVFKEE